MLKYLIFILLAIPTICFAQDVATPPAWLGDLLLFVGSIPTVGPIIVEVFKWIGVVASVFTALSVFANVVLKIPEIASRIAKADEIANKIAKINEKIQPYLKYLSIFNVQKKK